MTLTYIAKLAKVKVDLHAKDEGRWSNGSVVRAQTDGQTDRRTGATKCIISLAALVAEVDFIVHVSLHNYVTNRDSLRKNGT